MAVPGARFERSNLMANEKRVVVITGASSGIGKAISLSLASSTTQLCLIGRYLETLTTVAHKAEQRGATVNCYRADFNIDDEVCGAGAEILRDCPMIDILVHSAGFWSRGAIESSTAEEFDRHYRVNLRAPYLLTQELLPGIRERKGQIIFINSSAGQTARGGTSQYAASKHGLKALADGLREELNDAGVRVTSLFLGRTATAMQERIFADEHKEYHPELLIQPQDVASLVAHVLGAAPTVEITDISMRPRVKSY